MPNIFNKIGGLIFGEEEGYDEFEEEEVDEVKEPSIKPLPTAKKNSGRVVNIHATTQLEVAVLQPQTYEDAREIADRLKTKRAVVINLEELAKEDAIKVLDFVSGVVYALEGDIQKVSSGIFLIAPYNVSIANDIKAELKSTGIFPWKM
ncbi:MAG: cell division protein SepF [Clostridia bacterium]|nr:cell division protein SepF [Clostridia bacterium]